MVPRPVQSLAQRLASVNAAPRPTAPVAVALAITDLDIGGAESALVALACGLDRRRWAPEVYALGPEGALAERLRAAEIPTTCLDVQRHRPIRAVLSLARALRRQRPALVQSFLFHANLATRCAAAFAGRPWLVGGLRVAERGAAWHRVCDALTIRLSCGSVCVSNGVERFSRTIGRLPAERLTTIPNGIDLARFEGVEPCPREKIGVPDAAHLALFVGRLGPQKGVEILLEAAKLVIRQTENKWHCALVGDGPLRAHLEAITAADPLLSQRTHWLGRRGDVPSLLKTCDVLVLPSLWEGMPNVVLEAMALGLPVVGTAVEGTEDLVIPGETGWLVPPGEAASLTQALMEAMNDKPRRQRMGAAGRERVAEHFTQAQVIAAYDRLWSRVLGFD